MNYEEWDEEEPNAKKEALTDLEVETYEKVLDIIGDEIENFHDKLLKINDITGHYVEITTAIENG